MIHQRAPAIASRLKVETKLDRALCYIPGLGYLCFLVAYMQVYWRPAYPPGGRLVQNLKRLRAIGTYCTPSVVLCGDDIRDILIDKITDETERSVLSN